MNPPTLKYLAAQTCQRESLVKSSSILPAGRIIIPANKSLQSLIFSKSVTGLALSVLVGLVSALLIIVHEKIL